MPTVVTKTVGASGRDYTSLVAAIAAEEAIRADLVARDEAIVFECYDSVDTARVTVAGWTTSVSNSLTVRGAEGTDGFLIEPSSEINFCVDIITSHVAFENGKVVHKFATGSGSNYACFNLNQGSDGVSINNVYGTLEGSGTANTLAFVFAPAGDRSDSFRTHNCVFDCTGHSGSGQSFARTTRSTYAMGFGHNYQNITCVDADYFFKFSGFSSGDRPVDVTNVAMLGASSITDGYTGSSLTYTTCAVDVVSPPTGWTSGLASADFEDYAGGDYTPAAGGALDDAGTDYPHFLPMT